MLRTAASNVSMEFNMDQLWPYILIFIVGSCVFSFSREKKQTKELELIAKKLGFSFSKSGRDKTQSIHENLELFSKGSSTQLKNEMWGKDKKNTISIFEYSYIKGRGRKSGTYNQTVLSIEFGELNLPNFELKPENTLHKIGQVFGYQDIDFELFPVFSKKYLLRGNDEIKIRALFTPTVIKYFEKNHNICIEAQKNTLIFYKSSTRCKPDEIKKFYQYGHATLSNLV
jgi:hypothetical protein